MRLLLLLLLLLLLSVVGVAAAVPPQVAAFVGVPFVAVYRQLSDLRCLTTSLF